MPPQPLPPPRYLRYASLSVALAALVLFGLPYLLHLFTHAAGGFTVDQLNSFALAAALFWLVLQLAYLAYRALFRRFRAYQGECLEEQGKLFENVTSELRDPLYDGKVPSDARLQLFIERRKVAQFQFMVRCARLLFCFLALAYLLHLAQWAVTVGMGLRPGGLL